MSITLDRIDAGVIPFRERVTGLSTHGLTGASISHVGEFILTTITADEAEVYAMVAVQHVGTPCLPALLDERPNLLADFLTSAEPINAVALPWEEDEIMVMPPLFERVAEFEIAGFSFGMPFPFGFDD